jgi:hypothetical protein
VPIVGSTRYPTARTVTNLIRSLLNDNVVAAAQVPIVSAVRNASVVTVTTNGPHGLIAGATPDQTVISNIPLGVLSFNGTFYVASVISSTQFTYAQGGANETSTPNTGSSAGVGLGAVFTDPVLMQYVNSAYRNVQRALAMSGMPLFATDDILLVIPAVTTPDPSLEIGLTDGSSPQLPVDLLEPMKLWERLNGSNDDFTEMTDLTNHGGLPSSPQGSTLGMWEWRTDGIFFVGATNTQQIRLRYKRALLDLLDGTSQILIPVSQDCIAYLGAAMAAMARGSPLAEKWATAGEDMLEKLIAASTRQQQASIFRRKPNSSRTGGYWSGVNWGWRSGW